MDNSFMIWVTSYIGVFALIFKFILGVMAMLTMIKIMQALNKYINK
ncbi:MAG: hypothetical protein PT934_03230 [Peptoniphilaceae bacterium]|nr:hypothetical protein [Parvimonas sp.]MCI5997393.1 hypothetical protein [Parvimonas sp.]MDD7764765.1 hypothetical protein [Peptoniphilaceae bacterium]MDY3050765.1 hypothetical protein [Parvimonas sp.]